MRGKSKDLHLLGEKREEEKKEELKSAAGIPL